MTEAGSGLLVYRASRVEALLDPLRMLMQAAPPRSVLAPHELIAAHPGMRKWLGRELAIRQGPRGIAANLRIELPGAWLDQLARQVLGEDAVASRAYRRELLRWRIHEKLDTLDDAELAAYLGGDAGTRDRRRFQLADRLARLYSQYLVYRPDWLADWAAGRRGTVPAGFLSPLWKALREDIGLAHRGEQVAQLIRALDGYDPGPTEPLHVFGIAHLAPAELAVLRAVARRRLVALYVPDPCRAYWGGLTSPRDSLRALVERDPSGEEAENAFLEQGHPLLAAWGRMGQHFVLALDDVGAHVDTRHHEDEGGGAPESRLQGVQESIRRFEPDLIGEPAPSPRDDASLRAHACHTRLRELEVLRDALLDARSARPDLKPSDIVVMMPDIHSYLPLLPSVFGEAGRHEGPLPYHCADVAVARAHPLFEAFRRLLDLPQSRLTAPEVSDLLATPPIAARLGLGAGDAEVLVHWLDASRAAWALDGDFRARFDVPPIAEHTHAWAMDRLLAGYVAGADDEAALALPDGGCIVPVDGVHGTQAAVLGALDRLLVELREACADGATPRRASEWAQRFEQRIAALFLVGPADHEGRDALATLLQFVRGIADEPADSGLDPVLDFSVVRDLLLSRLDGVPERQRFLLGGITFCGMVPQRAIPFEVVAVLGLNDGEFPRAGRDGGLDPMSRHRRLGDRDVRNDDRYLFLETVMSARWRLHLSYIGEGVCDGKPRNPAAPLAELMAALDAGMGVERSAPQGESIEAKWKRLRPWWVRHPLQPFDARYFDGSDVALYSYSRAFAGMRGSGSASVTERPFVESRAAASTAPIDEQTSIALSNVLAYYRDPARQLLEGTLGLRLDALAADRLRESEPLEAKVEALDRVATRLFLQLAARGERGTPEIAPDWVRLTGVLPPGRIGVTAWDAERGKVDALLAAVADPAHAAHALFASPLLPSQPVQIEQSIGDHVVYGELRGVHDTAGTRWLVDVRPGKRESALGFRERIDLFLRWALLRLHTDPGHAVRVALVVEPPGKAESESESWLSRLNQGDAHFVATDAAAQAQWRGDLERRIGALLDFFLASQRQPQWYFPKTSWAALQGKPDEATKAWLGGDFHVGERDYAPGYARLLGGERDFGAGEDFAELHRHADVLLGLIDPGHPAKETP